MAPPAAPPAPHQVKRTPVDGSEAPRQKKHRGGRRGKSGGDHANASTHANANANANNRVTAAKPDTRMDVDGADDDEAKQAAPKTLSHLSTTTFAELNISALTKQAIVEELKYEYLTHVQNETFQPILAGKDVLAKAKTGNGKTIAFLLPLIEHLVRTGRSPQAIPALVISPTRELAQQIAMEARRVTSFHKMNIACFVGGAPINRDTRTLTNSTPVDILIVTPGRLQDHLGQDTGRINEKLSKLHMLVLDEADRLLDMGFRHEIMKIIKCLPAQRQTLLFSATLPASTEELKRVALRDDYVFVDTIDEDDQQTNTQAVQSFMTCPLGAVIPTVEHVLRQHIAQRPKDFKVMAFFPTARAAQYMAQLFLAAGFKDVLEMHSRKSQSARTKTADLFRASKRVMMFSSDVSARGVDYPDVSLVLQVGLTDRDQYIHRLGRTARAGSHGQGVLVIADFEKQLLRDLKDLPMTEAKLPQDFELSQCSTTAAIANLLAGSELEKSAQQSYQAWLGFYNSHLKRLGLSREALVTYAGEYSSHIGLQEVPRLEKKTLKKMNLFGVAGLVPAAFEERRGAPNNNGGRNNGGGRNNNNHNGGGGGNGGFHNERQGGYSGGRGGGASRGGDRNFGGPGRGGQHISQPRAHRW